MNVYEKLSVIQSKLKVSKENFNSFGNYKYRSCEDILEGIKPLLKEVQAVVTLTDTIEMIGDRFYIKATATITDTEKIESICVSALAREDVSKKGMDLAQVTGSVSSYARKYALNGLFCIDDTKDSDATNKDETKCSENNQSEGHTEGQAESHNNLTEKQIKRLFAIANSKGYNAESVKKSALKRYGITALEQLTKEQYDTMCNGYENI
jgi:hypothetical protein